MKFHKIATMDNCMCTFNSLHADKSICFRCPLLSFFKFTSFSKHSIRNTIGVSNGLDPDLSVLIWVHVCKVYQ